MSALQAIKDYLTAKFASHDIETLMTHFETAIEAKVEEGLSDLKQEIAELRNELTGKPTPALADVFLASVKPDDPAPSPSAKVEEAAAPIAQPEAIVETHAESVA